MRIAALPAGTQSADPRSRTLMGNCYFIGTSWGDAAVPQQFRALASELAQRGHRAILLVDGQRKDAEDPQGNPAVYTWPSERPTQLRDAMFLLGLARRYRPDCLIANFGSTNVMILTGRLTGIPVRIAWRHTLDSQIALDARVPRWKARWLKARKALIYRVSTHLVANSQATAEELQQLPLVRFRRDKTTVFCYSLADPLSAQPGELRQARRVGTEFVCPGRFHPSKGQDVLIRAVAMLKDQFPDVCVEFLGDGPARGVCEQLAQRLGIQECCRFVGSVSHAQVLACMAGALATVVPSRSEAFGLVNIESMSVGTPVVASKVGGIPEIIRDGVDGFLVPPEDPQALAEKLGLLLANPELADGMGTAARKRFLDCFEQRGAVARLADWLEEVVQAARKRGC